MTDGTSQGLFIVVAIVIFGIFVAMAYILFEDTLSPAIANMMGTATEQATNRLNKAEVVDTVEDSIFTYAFNETDKTATITGFVEGEEVLNLVLPTTVINNDQEYQLTNIGEGSFDNVGLETVEIADGIVVIEAHAFANNNLTEVYIPSSVIEIGNYAFSNNPMLLTISYDYNATLGTDAFENSHANLTIDARGKVEDEDNVMKVIDYYEDSIFTYTYSGNEATLTGFVEGKEQTDIVIPHVVVIEGVEYNVTSIGEAAFRINQLTSVVIPDSVTSIDDFAFSTNKLTNVVIPDSITSIGESAFTDNQLTSIVIPDSVTSIGRTAFSTNKLTNVVIPNSVTSIEYGAFSSNELSNVVIPDSVTSIENFAFQNNQLTSVFIPDSVTSIGAAVFRNNPNLKTVSIPSKTTLGSSVFVNTHEDLVITYR